MLYGTCAPDVPSSVKWIPPSLDRSATYWSVWVNGHPAFSEVMHGSPRDGQGGLTLKVVMLLGKELVGVKALDLWKMKPLSVTEYPISR